MNTANNARQFTVGDKVNNGPAPAADRDFVHHVIHLLANACGEPCDFCEKQMIAAGLPYVPGQGVRATTA